MTDKQATYRMALIDRALTDLAASYARERAGVREQRIAQAALIAALPTPTTSAEASAQIDALKAGIMGYARRNQAWAAGVMTRLTAAWGEDAANWPVASETVYGTRTDGERVAIGERVTADAMRVLVAGALA